jgi:hypothetical protein
MKPSGLLKHLATALCVAVIAYALSYGWVQHRRVVKGPWQVTFTSQSGTPAIVVNQPALQIQDVRIVFAGKPARTSPDQMLEFSGTRPVPFEVPGGKCVFLDPLFLPGTVVLDLFGHEIQLMPRTLTIDKAERPWRQRETLTLTDPAAPVQ